MSPPDQAKSGVQGEFMRYLNYKILVAAAVILTTGAVGQNQKPKYDNLLSQAIETNNVGDFNRLMRSSSLRLIINAGEIEGDTPLHVAAAKGNLEFIKRLLESGANVDIGNSIGATPLDTAIAYDQFEAARMILEKKPLVLEGPLNGDTALHVLAGTINDLIKVNQQSEPKVNAFESDAAKLFIELIEHGANHGAEYTNLRGEKVTPLTILLYELPDSEKSNYKNFVAMADAARKKAREAEPVNEDNFIPPVKHKQE
jgi:ankyrin repeat protein